MLGITQDDKNGIYFVLKKQPTRTNKTSVSDGFLMLNVFNF